MRTDSIEAIIFDLGKVIVPFDFALGYSQLSRLSRLTTEEIRIRISATGLVPRFETGLLEPEPFVAEIAKALGIQLTVEKFSQIWNSIFLPETFISEEMLLKLKERYRLLLLSNTNSIHFKGLEANYPLLRHFDHHVLSYQIKVMKPDPAIYFRAAELAGCLPASCLFIDDLLENVRGAQNIGMQAILFESLSQLQLDFDRLGILYR